MPRDEATRSHLRQPDLQVGDHALVEVAAIHEDRVEALICKAPRVLRGNLNEMQVLAAISDVVGRS